MSLPSDEVTEAIEEFHNAAEWVGDCANSVSSTKPERAEALRDCRAAKGKMLAAIDAALAAERAKAIEECADAIDRLVARVRHTDDCAQRREATKGEREPIVCVCGLGELLKKIAAIRALAPKEPQ